MKTTSSQQKTSQRRKTPVQRAASAGPGGMAVAAPQNRTGLPGALKNGAEALSGLSLDDVRVHYNSSKPAQLQALAYTQGTDIHVAPGQERHLPHEAWHVVQQKQGRVTPDNSIANMAIHDSPAADRAPEAVVQRVKDQQERSTAQSETAMTNKAVKLLKGQLQPVLKDHIFSAKPTDGEVDTANPVGLHAYTGGSLPGSLASVDTRGSKNRVHGLEWKWKGKSATKRSSMFPTWMSADRVCTYIALEYSDDTDVVKTDLTQLLLDNGISKSKAQYRISQGMNPELEKKGDTVYPVNEGLRAWIERNE